VHLWRMDIVKDIYLQEATLTDFVEIM